MRSSSDVEIIEISSSPEPDRRPPAKRPHPKASGSQLPGPVIELTDSESDAEERDLQRALKRSRVALPFNAEAGPSRPVAAPRTPPTRTRRTSVTRIPARGRVQPRVKTPLFLPGDSDEEHRAAPFPAMPGGLARWPSPTQEQQPQAELPLIEQAEVVHPQMVWIPVEELQTALLQAKRSVSPVGESNAPELANGLAVPPEIIQPDADPLDGYVAQILSIIPDVQPAHVLALVEAHLPTYGSAVVEQVLHLLLENPTYPKIDRNGKRKRDEGDDDDAEVDYANRDRKFKGAVDYVELSIERLLLDFPFIPKTHIRKTLFECNNLYVPTYYVLAEQEKQQKPPYTRKHTASRGVDKGKGRVRQDAEFDRERKWLLINLDQEAAQKDAAIAAELESKEIVDNGEGIECGCCFGEYPFSKMIQCPDAHLFCTSCMTSYASNLLGAHDPNIVCMDQSGCKLAFALSELRRFLTPKLMDLYERVKQTKEIEMAGIEGLVECPFCEYKVVIENDFEKLFRCERKECGAVSCRECKKLDHLPKSCKEMEDDKLLDGRHTIEEAMTRALMRNCPKCHKGFIKEGGCNKMTCPNCHTLSCYICRSIINGYDHFNTNKCSLWDAVEQRSAEEVGVAAKKAMDEYKRNHPDVDEKAIAVDLPPPPPLAPAGGLVDPFGGIREPVMMQRMHGHAFVALQHQQMHQQQQQMEQQLLHQQQLQRHQRELQLQAEQRELLRQRQLRHYQQQQQQQRQQELQLRIQLQQQQQQPQHFQPHAYNVNLNIGLPLQVAHMPAHAPMPAMVPAPVAQAPVPKRRRR